jgi:hypothetical protein
MHDRGTDSKAESIFLSLLVTYIATERKKSLSNTRCDTRINNILCIQGQWVLKGMYGIVSSRPAHLTRFQLALQHAPAFLSCSFLEDASFYLPTWSSSKPAGKAQRTTRPGFPSADLIWSRTPVSCSSSFRRESTLGGRWTASLLVSLVAYHLEFVHSSREKTPWGIHIVPLSQAPW